MSADAQNLWYWITTRVDDHPASWCPNPAISPFTGPEYEHRVTLAVWDEVKNLHNKQKVVVDVEYYYLFLDGQVKGDGRGAQGNVHLKRRNDNGIYMNLHIPLYRVETIVEKATDGGGDWTTKKANYFKHK